MKRLLSLYANLKNYFADFTAEDIAGLLSITVCTALFFYFYSGVFSALLLLPMMFGTFHSAMAVFRIMLGDELDDDDEEQIVFLVADKSNRDAAITFMEDYLQEAETIKFIVIDTDELDKLRETEDPDPDPENNNTTHK